MTVGPIRRCRGSQIYPGASSPCPCCKKWLCRTCGRHVALYPNGTLAVHLPGSPPIPPVPPAVLPAILPQVGKSGVRGG